MESNPIVNAFVTIYLQNRLAGIQQLPPVTNEEKDRIGVATAMWNKVRLIKTKQYDFTKNYKSTTLFVSHVNWPQGLSPFISYASSIS